MTRPLNSLEMAWRKYCRANKLDRLANSWRLQVFMDGWNACIRSLLGSNKPKLKKRRAS